jgi:hypothetical protein
MTYTPHDPLCAGRSDQCKCPALLQRKEDGRAKMLEILAALLEELATEPQTPRDSSQRLYAAGLAQGVDMAATALRELW